ncbi:MAG: SDR family oxidoreductase [Opitutaceae bacterium]|nr:SDR family oxidoreductase [Opitutaceae bacterium]
MSKPLRVHALVTGASRGIGRAIALHLAARGCRVAVHYAHQRAAANDTLAALPGQGHATFAADAADPGELKRLWQEVVHAFGRIDLLVNNAGVYSDHPPLETTSDRWEAEWERTLAVNLLAPARLAHLAARHMAAAELRDEDFGRGRIVNISSRGAFRGEPHSPAYGASKAGLNSLSQSLAKALARNSIFVFCLAPGWVETEMAARYLEGPRGTEILSEHPLGRVARAEEIARTAVFCALDAPAAMTGSIIDVNGASYLRT